jgi:sulfite reductase alpha subunit-like flavoprotein
MSSSEIAPRPAIPILYGTETGNSQDLAELLAKRLRRLRFAPKLYSIDDYPINSLLTEPVIFFLVSTTGQGELPRNTKKFWKFLLRRKLPPTLLTSVRFSTFGLGDSSYPRYNWAVRKLHTRLLNLGAKDFVDRGEGDEQSPEGVDKIFQEWENKVCEQLEAAYPLPAGVEPYSLDTLLPPLFPIEIFKTKPKRDTSDILKVQLSRSSQTDDATQIYKGKVVKNDRVTSLTHYQDVRHLVFNTSDNTLEYDPGDTVALYPTNDPQDVQALLDHQGWASIADYKVSIPPEFTDCVFGGLVSPLTVRSLLTHHLDIMAIPRRSFFANVWHFSEGLVRERDRLLEFSTVDGLEDLYDYANRPRRSILETVTEFDSLKIPIEYLLDVFPVLRPRLFSIASPQNQQNLELSIAIVKYKTILRRIRQGVCTKYVAGLEKDNDIPFTIHRNGLYTPKSYLSNIRTPGGTPLILIGTGTGIAPIISVVKTLLAKDAPVKRIAPIVVFFGCRGYNLDFHFKNDWKQLVTENSGILKLFVAFSQERNAVEKDFDFHSSSGVHIQSLIYDQKEAMGSMLVNDNAAIYLCGSSGAMPKQIRITLKSILEETVEEFDGTEAEETIFDMEKNGRFIQETW